MLDKYVAYYRVSTAKQGHSGLGLEAQRQAVKAYLSVHGAELTAEFTEVESGRHGNRPELQRALAACRVQKAPLLIAKLDRLARNVAFVSSLMEGSVDFRACDFPHANRLTIHILAAVAEHEARMISERTKAALAAAKAAGRSIGGFRGRYLTEADRQRGKEIRSANADAYAEDLRPLLEGFSQDGRTPTHIAAALNAQHIPAPRGGRWQACQVSRILKRLDGKKCASNGPLAQP